MPWLVVGLLIQHRKLIATAVASGVLGIVLLFAGGGGGESSNCGGSQGLGNGWGADTVSALAPNPQGPQKAFTAWAQREVSYQGHTYTINPTQNADAIIAAVVAQDLPGRAAVIALATAMQESSLNQYAVNGDTIGLFQQDTSYQNRTDPTTSAAAFLQRLIQVPSWQALPLTDAAQDVQRSAYPQAYAVWEQAAAQAIVNLTGGEAPPSNSSAPGVAATCAGSGVQLTSAQVPGQAFPIITPLPSIKAGSTHQVLEQIPVPTWPPGIQTSGRIEPNQVGNQCVQAALWTYAVLHLSDPGYADPPTFAGVAQAADMYAAAQTHGWNTATSPVTGSMVVFNRQVDSAGHIATVLATGPQDFEVIEQNWLNFDADQSGEWGTFDLALIPWPDAQVTGFIVAPPGAPG
jgi:hypothetical protein